MNEEAHREKARAALSSVLYSLLLTGLKLWAGLATGSLGIFSEALHSGLDFVAAAITFYAVKISAIPADENHPYGHGKVENLSALVETILLVVTSVWIVWEAVQRMFFYHVEVDLSFWAFAVILVSIAVDVNRSAMLRRTAKKHKSQALEADALHFTTDIWSSCVVLLGLVGLWCSRFATPGSAWEMFLKKADSLAAMGVAVVILFVAWGLCKRSIYTLMDGGTEALHEKISRALREKAPWYPVSRLRVREVGPMVYAEMDVTVPKEFPVEVAHDVTEQITEIVNGVLDQGEQAEVTVHVEPQETSNDTPHDVVAQYLALRHRIGVHGYMEVNLPEGKMVFMDVEMPPDWSLEKACKMGEVFEEDLKKALGVQKVALRIEPDKREIRMPKNVRVMTAEEIYKIVEEYCAYHSDMELKGIMVEESAGTPLVFIRVGVDDSHSVQSAFNLSEQMVWELRKKILCAGKIIPIMESRED